ncbi:MAG: hypothetical protein JL50_11010 [Peptococcaceae bacterium BICA1-7]|nr:MAG: hypothetical protein JL50_11010 [Peptococcaceae bacterium BICA1-7]HBV95815.1 hypothetical protein [Desulfotomaculum sp.]
MIEVNEIYVHLPTRKPVKVLDVTETRFTVYTLDDMFIHKGKLVGGCTWSLNKEHESKFVKVD